MKVVVRIYYRLSVTVFALALVVRLLFTSSFVYAQTSPDVFSSAATTQAPLVPNGLAPSFSLSSSADPTGSYSLPIPLEVAPNGGFSPHVGISYSSTGGNGTCGVGCNLAIGSAIRRVSLGHGVPSDNADPSDMFELDGSYLYPCGSLKTVSCSNPSPKYPSATYYYTRVDQVERIAFDLATGWHVWLPSGVERDYTDTQTQLSGAIVAWLLMTETNPSGDTIAYEYTPHDPKIDCHPYLSSVYWNNHYITIYYEPRADTWDYGIGGGTTCSVRYRPLTLDEQTCTGTGLNRVRTYGFQYGSSGATNRSLLTGLVKYGNDAVVSTDGVISGGTQLPPEQLSYPSQSYAFGSASATTTTFDPVQQIPYDTLGFDARGAIASVTVPESAYVGQPLKSSGLGAVGTVQHVSGDFDCDGRPDHAVVTFHDSIAVNYFLLQADGSYRSTSYVYGDPSVTSSPSPKAPSGYTQTGEALVVRRNGCYALRLFSNNLFQGTVTDVITGYTTLANAYSIWSQGILSYDASSDAFAGTNFYEVANTRADLNDLNALASSVRFAAGNIAGDANDEIVVAHAPINANGYMTQTACTSNTCAWQIDYYAADLDPETTAPFASETSELADGATSQLEISGTSNITTADVNGDGRADLIFTGAIAGSVSSGLCDGYILNGVCTGTPLFPIPSDIENGSMACVALSTPTKAAVIADAYAPHLAASYPKQYVHGKWQCTASQFPNYTFFFGGPGQFAIGDVDGDGNADVIRSFYGTAKSPSGLQIEVFQSNGTQFVAQSIVSLTSSPTPLSTIAQVVDLNRDGRSDLLYGSLGQTIYAAVSQPGGGFAPWYSGITLPYPSVSQQTATGPPLAGGDVVDLDGSGELEYVVFGALSSSDDVAAPKGCLDPAPKVTPTCTSHTLTFSSFAYPLGDTLSDVGRWLHPDLNNDGVPDVLRVVKRTDRTKNSTTMSIETRVRVYDKTTGTWSWTTTTDWPYPVQRGRYEHLGQFFVGDLDAVGMQEWIEVEPDRTLCSGAGGVHITTHYQQQTICGWTISYDPREWVVGDFDGDGHTDVMNVFANSGTIQYSLYLGHGNYFGNLAFESGATDVPTLSGQLNMSGVDPAMKRWLVGDFDANGATDVVGVEWNVQPSPVDSTLVLGVTTATLLSARVQVKGEIPGAPRVIVPEFFPGMLDQSNSPSVLDASNWYWNPEYFQIGDLNGDGMTDLIYVDAGTALGFLVGQGDGMFMPKWTAPSVMQTSNRAQLRLTDLNGDGRTDVVQVAQDSSGNITLASFLMQSDSNGVPSFGDAVSVSLSGMTPTPYATLFFEDVDLDGWANLISLTQPNIPAPSASAQAPTSFSLWSGQPNRSNDVVTKVINEMGGSASIVYETRLPDESSVPGQNPYNSCVVYDGTVTRPSIEGPSSGLRVHQITLDSGVPSTPPSYLIADGVGSVFTIHYDCPVFSPAERRSLGYALISTQEAQLNLDRSVGPITNRPVQTTTQQTDMDDICGARSISTERSRDDTRAQWDAIADFPQTKNVDLMPAINAAGNVDPKQGPIVCRTQDITTVLQASTAVLLHYTDVRYDAYGMTEWTATTDFTNSTTSNEEHTIDPASFIVTSIGTDVFSGFYVSSPTGVLPLRSRRYCYDQTTFTYSWTVTCSAQAGGGGGAARGLPTSTFNWTNQSNSYLPMSVSNTFALGLWDVPWSVVQSLYDSDGNITQSADANLNITSYQFADPFPHHHFIQQTVDAKNFASQSEWDFALEVVTATTDANAVVAHVQHDALGRTTEQWVTSSAVPSLKVDDTTFTPSILPGVSGVVTHSNAIGSSAGSVVDGFGRVYYEWQTGSPVVSGTTSTPRTVARSTAYATIENKPSRRSEVYDTQVGIGATESFLFDDNSQLVVHTHFNGTDKDTATFAIDSTNNLLNTTTTDSSNIVRTTATNGLGQTVRVDEGQKSPISTYYTSNVVGDLLSTKDSAGNVVSFIYDLAGHLVSVTDGDRGTIQTTYDAAGNVLLQSYPCSNSDGDSTCTSYYVYDGLNRATMVLYFDDNVSANSRTIIRNYDETDAVFGAATAHHLTSVNDSDTQCTDHDSTSRTSRVSYDAFGGTAAVWRCVDTNKSWQMAYDNMPSSSSPVGRLSAITYPNGEVVSYSYDAASRVSGVTGTLPGGDAGLPTTTNYIQSMGYDESGHLLSVVYGNGVAEAYAYTTDQKLLQNATIASGTNTLYDATYGYEANGLVASASYSAGALSGQSFNYGYDGLSRLTSVTGSRSEAFDYDAIGNLTSATTPVSNAIRSYTFGTRPHAPTGVSWTDSQGNHSVAMTYDAAGHLSTYKDGSDSRTYAWDVRNMLTQVASSETLTMTYDADGNRASVSDGTNTTYYPFAEIVSDKDGDRYCYTNSARMFACRSNSDGLIYTHADRLGSTVLATDDKGNAKTNYDFSAYGTRLTAGSDDPSLAAKKMFTGAVQDDGTSPVAGAGLVYMRSRFYSPELSRFISPDVVVQSGVTGLNPYQYANANPISNIDPSGAAAQDTTGGNAPVDEPPPMLGNWGPGDLFSFVPGPSWEGVEIGYSYEPTDEEFGIYLDFMDSHPNMAGSFGAPPSVQLVLSSTKNSLAAATVMAGLDGLLNGGIGALIGDAIGWVEGFIAGKCGNDPLACQAVGIVTGATLNAGLPNSWEGMRQQSSADVDFGPANGGPPSLTGPKQVGPTSCVLACMAFLVGNGPGEGGYISQYQVAKQMSEAPQQVGNTPRTIYEQMISRGSRLSDAATVLRTITGENYVATLATGGPELSTIATPFMAAVYFTQGPHAVVIMAVSGGQVYYIDPSDGSFTSKSVGSMDLLGTLSIGPTDGFGSFLIK